MLSVEQFLSHKKVADGYIGVIQQKCRCYLNFTFPICVDFISNKNLVYITLMSEYFLFFSFARNDQLTCERHGYVSV